MKKILIITLEYPPQIGGIASYVHQFAEALSDPKKIVLYAPNTKDSEKWDKQQKFKIIRNNPYFPLFLWPRWIRLFFQINKIVKQENIDIIYLHHFLPVGYVALLIKKFKKIPYIVFSHGTDVLAGTKNKWKKKMTNMVTTGAERLVFNSDSLKNRLIQILPELEQKSIVIYPCPEDGFYIPSEKEKLKKLKEKYALDGKKVMLSIARLDEGKGFTHMIRILPKILKKNPNLVWFVVGDGPKKDFLIKEIQKNNLQNIVRYVGHIPHHKIKPFYYLADLFVLLTHPDEGKEEGLGLVFLEAAAAGLPAVAGRSGGVDEAVIHTQTGLVVDIYKGDQGVVDAVTQILTNKSYAKRLGQQAQARMREEFQWDHQLERLKPWIEDSPKNKV